MSEYGAAASTDGGRGGRCRGDASVEGWAPELGAHCLLGAFATALITRCSAAIRAWLDVCVPQSAAAAGASLGLYREPAGLEHAPAE